MEDPFHPQRKAHPCFGVSKIDELAERLQNARYSSTSALGLTTRLFFADPTPFAPASVVTAAAEGTDAGAMLVSRDLIFRFQSVFRSSASCAAFASAISR